MATPTSAAQISAEKLFDLSQTARGEKNKFLLSLLSGPIERTLSIDTINELYLRTSGRHVDESFFKICLDTLGVNYAVPDSDLLNIPTDRPVVVTSNHPFGGIEGVILAHIMSGARTDIRILANHLLTNIPELQEYIIPVDPFGNRSSTASNARAFRQAIRWLEQGGLLITFPSGTVSHLKLFQREVNDPDWQPHIAGLIQQTKSQVLPVFFDGRNGALFQIAGLIHPRLRTALLPRELVNKGKKTIGVRIGRILNGSKLSGFKSRTHMINFIRMNTYMLKNRPSNGSASAEDGTSRMQSIIPALSSAVLSKEISSLPQENLLLDTDDFSVYMGTAPQIPNILNEIGRLREVTFRSAGEGTGKSIDLDSFDDHYLHLFLWDKDCKAVAGAYRLGLIADILNRYGSTGLYTTTLFRFKPEFLISLDHAIELGRSFIHETYQRKYNCLSLLWKGIGQYIIRHPENHLLLGPVSISRDYHNISKYMIIKFLRENNLDPTLADQVRPRNPYKYVGKRSGLLPFSTDYIRDIEDVSVLVSEIEKDGKGIPVLLRHYLRLNARLLSFNVDSDFSNVVDGLILVDLAKTDAKILKRFLSPAGYQIFAVRHGLMTTEMGETAESNEKN